MQNNVPCDCFTLIFLYYYIFWLVVLCVISIFQQSVIHWLFCLWTYKTRHDAVVLCLVSKQSLQMSDMTDGGERGVEKSNSSLWIAEKEKYKAE